MPGNVIYCVQDNFVNKKHYLEQQTFELIYFSYFFLNNRK